MGGDEILKFIEKTNAYLVKNKVKFCVKVFQQSFIKMKVYSFFCLKFFEELIVSIMNFIINFEKN